MIPPIPSNTSRLLYIELVITMGWVNSPDFFFSTSGTSADNANAYVLDLTSPFMIYPQKDEAYHTSAAPQVYHNHLKYIDVYMGNLLCAVQGEVTQKQRVSELT